MFIRSDKDLNLAGEIITAFYEWAGAIINQTKTYVMGLGSWENRNNWQINWATTNSKV